MKTNKTTLTLLLLLLVETVLCLSTPHSNGVTRREALVQSTQTATLIATVFPSTSANAAYIDPSTDLPKITDRVYMDVQIGSGDGGPTQRIVMGLFGDVMPRVTANFVALCRDNRYAGTTFYRVISDVTVQGGAIGDTTGKGGKSGISSSLQGGKPFEPDNYDVKHSTLGLVSMVRGVGGSVDSRFFINTAPDAGWADDRYAAFGIVQEGMDFVTTKMNNVKVQPPSNSPIDPVKIIKSGLL